jgi:hypothetical protein
MMVALTSIIERYRGKFHSTYGNRITRHQVRAMDAVMDCRTARYGSMALGCDDCDQQSIQYHACGNRACHRCQHYDTNRWLDRQQQKLLPVNYFMVTFTLPAELRVVTARNQKVFYNLLMDCAHSTLKTFAGNHRDLDEGIGMTTVLHTHTRRLDYHPHVHIIVPAVTVDAKRCQCTKLRGDYLFNAFALAKVFRARFIEAMIARGYTMPVNTPKKWVVDCRLVGKGLPALKYLSRYLYRGVINEKNILADDGDQVTFGYVENRTGSYKTRTVPGETFLWLVYQHVLPKGFRRVRDYGYLNGNAKKTLSGIQRALGILIARLPEVVRPAYRCHGCGGELRVVAFMKPVRSSG